MSKLPSAKVSRRFKKGFTLIRWIFILACLGFVAFGWKNSVTKYLDRQTSVGTIVNETLQFRFPSVTLCPGFRNKANLVSALEDLKNKSGLISINATIMKRIIEKYSYRRQDFLTLFSQAKLADVGQGTGVLLNDSVWTETVPHQYFSGKCFTYDPPFDSLAADWNGIRIGFKQQAKNKEELRPMNEPQDALDHVGMTIFLHDRGDFQFSRAEERPRSKLISQELLHYDGENIMQLHYGTFTSLSTSRKPCSDEPGYNMRNCVAEFYSKFIRTGCLVPCRFSLYSLEPTYRPLTYPDKLTFYQNLDNGSDWVVNLYFKDFKFKHEKEFLVCDYTCLLGEIGGNLGFFLGGSFLAYLDLVLKLVARIISP